MVRRANIETGKELEGRKFKEQSLAGIYNRLFVEMRH